MAERRRERKVVTVLFCDLVGFTQQAEALDPEDVEAILRPYHERVRTELERHGGTVEKFIGDAVVALFGAPVAHEDDPERAVRAALAIREFAVQDGLELRVGITTGEALVSLDAAPSEGEGMASGDVVNTAARLQSSAPVNGVLVDATTYRATRQAIEYAEAPPVEAKGKSRPVEVWLAREARARFGVDVAHEARAELVGRERELTVLREAFARALQERTPQLVTLVGVPGIGKSRLVYELSRIADADPELITWRQGRCLAYGDGVTLWALGEIVKAQAGILEQDPPDEVAAKVRQSVNEALGETSDVSWVASHVLSLLGLGGEAEMAGDRRNEGFAAWRRFLEALAEQRPLVLVFEDLHWADESLLDFVDELVDWVTDVPLLIVATARPELLERRPNWSGGKLDATMLALQPLSDEQTALLLGNLLGSPVLASESQVQLLERAGGNPLYAEQFSDLYLETGSTAELQLPETLQGIIAARLDGLRETEKELLQDAAVVGKVFWATAVRASSDDVVSTLHALERKGFVRRQKRSSLEGESEFAFAHALVRDVAYGQIARAGRAERHRRTAEWIESLGRPEDHAEMLAHHWRSALDLARAAGDADEGLVRRARLALRDAGDRASALNIHATAATQYDDALALWPEDDAEWANLLFRRARALHLAYDEKAEGALETARDALLAAGDPQRAAEAEVFLAYVAWNRGQGELTRSRLSRAHELVGTSASASAARVLATSSRMRVIASEYEEGQADAEAALEMAEQLGLDELRAHALTTIGMAKNYLAEGSGTEDMERALELALQIDSPIASSIVNNLAVQTIIVGDLERTGELYAEALRLAERFGDRASMRFVGANLIWVDYMQGRWEQAAEAADAFVAECEAGSPHTNEWAVRALRGEMRAARGDSSGAVEDHLAAVRLVREKQDPLQVAGALALLAGLYVERKELAEARQLVDEVVALVRMHGVHGAIASLALAANELDVTEELRTAVEESPGPQSVPWRTVLVLILEGDLRGAADVYATMPNPALEAKTRLHAGERLLALGEREQGEAELRRALAFHRGVAATPYVRRAEELLGLEAYSDSA
jgi:class 3 adenylate cyclase/tetratricopeptide (TPR) repeat protein